MSAASMKARVESASVIQLFGPPDMDILRAGRRSTVPMPAELFSDAWGLLKDIAEGSGAPVDYVGLGFITSAASLIGGKRRVKPFSGSPWSEPCILWAGAVGDPSSNKSPALDAVTSPLRAIEATKGNDHKARILVWQADCERAKAEKTAWQDAVKAAQKDALPTPPLQAQAVEPDEPQRRRALVMDATPEALGSILAGNPAGTLHMRDELAGWLTSFDRYAPGGREFWLEAYGGRMFVIDRKGSKGPLTIPFTGVSVLGGIQPEKLAATLLDGADDGLVSRFLWAWPEAIQFRRPNAQADIAQLEDLYRRLDEVRWGLGENGDDVPVTLPLSSRASDMFEAWAIENERDIDDTGALYKNFLGKLRGATLRLSLVGEFVRWAWRGGEEPREVSAEMLGAAADLIDIYFKPMAQRVYGDASLPQVEKNAAILARYIRKHRFANLNARDLLRSPHKSHLPGMRTAQALNEALALLCDADWLRPVGTREGDTGGRQRKDYLVNPAVMEAQDG